MKRRNLLVAIASVAAAVVASVFASLAGKAEAGKCVPTQDGKFECKATGAVMETPCCADPCCW